MSHHCEADWCVWCREYCGEKYATVNCGSLSEAVQLEGFCVGLERSHIMQQLQSLLIFPSVKVQILGRHPWAGTDSFVPEFSV